MQALKNNAIYIALIFVIIGTVALPIIFMNQQTFDSKEISTFISAGCIADKQLLLQQIDQGKDNTRTYQIEREHYNLECQA